MRGNEYTRPRPRPAAYRASRRRGRTRLETFILAAGVAALLTAGGGLAVDLSHAGTVLPNVAFGAVSLSGLTQSEARGVLSTEVNAFEASPAVFAYGEREWRPTAGEMGVRVDVDAMAAAAVAAGRHAPIPLRYPAELLTLVQRRQVPFRATLDQGQLQAFLHAVAAEVDRDPVSAALSVKAGQLVVGPAASGQKVDLDATAARVAVPVAPQAQRVEVVVATVPPALTDVSVQDAQAAAQSILASPLALHLGEKTWRLSPAQLGAMIDFKRVPAAGGASGGEGGERLVATLDEGKVAAYVKTLAAEVDRPARDAVLRWNGSGATVVREATTGIKLDQAASARAIIAQAPGETRDVTLVATITKPAVTSDLETVGAITSVVATGSSKFAGSPGERMNNIAVAASKLDGVVIPAGSTFSFLRALGPITKEAGYQEGLTIQGDETVPGIGGGVCQVSTTLFRAAFFAGLPIVERHQHTYRVGYYEQDGSPVGFDAAVYDPGVDLRFKNDTDAPILLQALVDQKAATISFKLYGAPTSRDVKLTPVKANEIKAPPKLPDVLDATLPKGTRKQVEWSADGVDATIKRVVTAGGKTLLSDSFFSRYVPWREKWLTGPAADATPAPAPTAKKPA